MPSQAAVTSTKESPGAKPAPMVPVPANLSPWKLFFFGVYTLFLTAVIIFAVNEMSLRTRKDVSVLTSWKQEHESTSYDIGVVGNSMAYVNVDFDVLGNILNAKIIDTSIGGSRAPYWYLAFKNLIVGRLKNPPKQVIIVFRDADLTTTTNGAVGYQEADLLSIAQPDDDALYEKTLIPVKGFIRANLLRSIPVYAQKETIRIFVYDMCRDLAMKILNRTSKRIGDDIVKFVTRRAVAGKTSFKPEKNFDVAIGSSYLPLIFDEAKKKNIQLIFVRVREKKYADGKQQAPKTQRYFADLAKFLKQNNAIFLDFTDEKRIEPKFYRGKNDDHMNADGKMLFTQILGEALEPYVR